MKKTIYILFIFIVTIAIISISGLDIKISSLLYSKVGGWIYSPLFLWSLLYRYGQSIPNIIGIVSLLIFIFFLITKKSRATRQKALFALLVFLLGPGLIVQTLKVTWGRPRPVESTIYGGTMEFRTPFDPNFKLAGNTNNGNSFPSGHAAAGFYTMVLYFIFRKKWILALTLTYGILMGAARIVQGGHFLSDVVSSFFIVYICIELFAFLVKKQE